MIGIFDGVHKGHQSLLNKAKEVADGRKIIALTFDPHPAYVFSPENAPSMLTTLSDRVELLKLHNADQVAVMKFDQKFSQLPPEDFVQHILIDQLKASTVIVGRNFTYGFKAAGNVETLTGHGFTVIPMDLVDSEGATISSTRIRSLVHDGQVEQARALLGRPHRLEGVVVHGEKRGRTIGYPTANLGEISEQTIPADGIYAGWLTVGINHWPAAISIGTNPTFDGERERQVEAYAIDQEGLDLYDKKAAIEFGWRLRDTLKFNGIDELIAQMRIDVDQARHLTDK